MCVGLALNTMFNLALWQCSVLPTHPGNLLCPSTQLLKPNIKYFSENSLLIPNSKYHVRKRSLFDFKMSRLNSFQRFVFQLKFIILLFFRLPHSIALWNKIFWKILRIDFVWNFIYVSAKCVQSVHKLKRSFCPSVRPRIISPTLQIIFGCSVLLSYYSS